MTNSIQKLIAAENKPKLDYVQTQIREMKAITIRNEVDIYINKNADWENHELEQVESKIKELEKQNKTLGKALVALEQLEAELSK